MQSYLFTSSYGNEASYRYESGIIHIMPPLKTQNAGTLGHQERSLYHYM